MLISTAREPLESSESFTVKRSEDWLPDSKDKEELLLQAIFWAEGGYKTKFPYGIKSVSCKGHDDCRRICRNTIRNNIVRYTSWGKDTHASYLAFLGSRYAPVGVSNDPQGLNVNWISNVQWFLDNPKEI